MPWLRKAVEEPYFAVFWSRWSVWDPIELEKAFGEDYSVERRKWIIPDPMFDFRIGSGYLTRYEIIVRADTLNALLSPVRAVLYQQEPREFTLHDNNLYERIQDFYRLKRLLPFLPRVEIGARWRLRF